MGLLSKPLIAAAGLVVLTACGDRQIGSTWTQEAGFFLDEGAFGNPTMHNMLVQMCHSHIPKGQIMFEPKVVRAPAGSPKPYIRRARCSGHLNGKYAQVIFQEYVASATEIPPVRGSVIDE